MRPKNVILLEIITLVTNFNDADLFYYLLLDAFAGMVHHGGRGMAPAAVILPTRAIVLQSVCVFVGCAFHVYLKGLKAFFRTGSLCGH